MDPKKHPQAVPRRRRLPHPFQWVDSHSPNHELPDEAMTLPIIRWKIAYLRRLLLRMFGGLAVAFLALGTALWLYSSSTTHNIDSRGANRDHQRQDDINRLAADETRIKHALDVANAALAENRKNTQALHAAACFIIAIPPSQPRTPSQLAELTQFANIAGCPIPK